MQARKFGSALVLAAGAMALGLFTTSRPAQADTTIIFRQGFACGFKDASGNFVTQTNPNNEDVCDTRTHIGNLECFGHVNNPTHQWIIYTNIPGCGTLCGTTAHNVETISPNGDVVLQCFTP